MYQPKLPLSHLVKSTEDHGSFFSLGIHSLMNLAVNLSQSPSVISQSIPKLQGLKIVTNILIIKFLKITVKIIKM